MAEATAAAATMMSINNMSLPHAASMFQHRHRRCQNHHPNHGHGLSSLPIINPATSSSSMLGFASQELRRALSLGSSSNSIFYGRRLQGPHWIPKRGDERYFSPLNAEMRIGRGKAQKWWEKGHQSNMKEVNGAQDLVDSLLNAGDKLVVVDFFSPGCGGCRALHPKICQLAEMNADVQFLLVNYEEHKSMCYTLNVHVLPFFRFYRGTEGRLCSFSCTNATIKKFKDALAKHSPDCCSLGPPKGLEEKELIALAANKGLSFSYKPKPQQQMPVPEREETMAETTVLPALHLNANRHHGKNTDNSNSSKEAEEKSLVASGR